MADLKFYSPILHECKNFMSCFQPGAPLFGAIRSALTSDARAVKNRVRGSVWVNLKSDGDKVEEIDCRPLNRFYSSFLCQNNPNPFSRMRLKK
jgi:hypothetical protein